MAQGTRRKPARKPEINPEARPGKNPGDELQDAVATASLFDAEGDSRVAIYRRDDITKKFIYHGHLSMEDATEEGITKLFGGGRWRCQLKVTDDVGREVIKRQRDIDIPGPYKPPVRELPGSKPPAQQNGASTVPEIGTLDGGMNPNAALNHALVASVIDLLKKQNEPRTPAIQVPWGEILTSVVGPLVLKLVEKGNSKSEMLEMLEQMKALIPQNPAAAPVQSTMTDMVKGIKELMSLKDIVEGKEAPPDPETAMWGAAMKAMDIAGQYITNKKDGDSTPAQPQLTAGVPGMPKWKLMLLSQRKRIVEAASYNLPPDTAAETAITFLPQQVHGVLTEFLELPDHVDITIQTIPELAEFRGWTEQFMAQLREQFLGGEEEVEDAPETERGEVGES